MIMLYCHNQSIKYELYLKTDASPMYWKIQNWICTIYARMFCIRINGFSSRIYRVTNDPFFAYSMIKIWFVDDSPISQT